MAWRHNSGFSVHNGVHLTRDDETGKEALAQYIIRSPFSVQKITYNDETGTVIYKSKRTPSKSIGGRKNFQVFTAAEFIAAITQHIPEKSFQLVRYYGWYSNRGRGDREKREQLANAAIQPGFHLELIDISEYRPKKIPSPKWRECIKKVWEVDPLLCPKCNGEMKIVSFITEKNVILKILKHLDLWKQETPTQRAPPAPIHDRHYEPVDDGWPGYEEPTIMIH